MKTLKLVVHNNKTSKIQDQDILISSKDFPDVKPKDVLEVYHADDEWNRLLLQVKSIPEDSQLKESVSIEQGIANAFSLKPYNSVIVNRVDKKNVGLDLVELLFKEQYFGRSDMWRMCKTITNTCVYLKKTIEYAEMRAQVNELWAKGENVTCGVITEDTRIVFRSPTAVVQIFIQMSTEMWEFDLHGDLYYEKAVNGFLTDLFDKWKEQNCLHDVTIVLFSRTFYEAKSLDEFPPSIRECLIVDSNGNIYEDYYRVIVQNERYEEWHSILRQLRIHFNEYQEYITNFHSNEQLGWKMPKARLSNAQQGNFLETLNMSLNLFENYYLDRNFDRTGKVSVVITPGPGVFEVDRQLANITKQRTIDCGVGSDLVCMGEQPLHAAPLFKFRSKSTYKSIEVGDDYNIPHWMNHSFYMSKKQIEDHMNLPFVPRIKPDPALLKELKEIEEKPHVQEKNVLPPKNNTSNDDNIPFVDYDEYDLNVFKLPSRTLLRTFSTKGNSQYEMPKTFAEAKQNLQPRQRHQSDEVSQFRNGRPEKDSSYGMSIPGSSHDDMSMSFSCFPIQERSISRVSYDSSEGELVHPRPVVGSAGSPVGHSRNLRYYRPRRALINPFAPSRLQFKMTSNRRRWVHAFPVDHKGVAIQARHVHSVQHPEHDDFPWSDRESQQSPMLSITYSGRRDRRNQDIDQLSQCATSLAESPAGRRSQIEFAGSLRRQQSSRSSFTSKSNLFGSVKADSDQCWSPDMTTGYDWRPLDPDLQHKEGSRLTKSIFSGDIQSNMFVEGLTVDWKSLTIPASLPVTTDYFPDRRSIQFDYFVSEYALLPEYVNAEIWASWPRSPTCEDKTLFVYRRQPLTNHQVFMELISQRLGQGFQLIKKKKSVQQSETSAIAAGSTQFMRAIKKEPDEEYYMSIGRIYHKLTMQGQTISVTRYWPRHPQPQLSYNYKYRFQAPDSYSYDVSWTNFSSEQLENYNWNHLDQYICTQGDWEHGLIDPLKYWRSRFFLLPSNNVATKKICEKETERCDIYEEKSSKELKLLINGFIKFLETMNKLKRTQRKSKAEASNSPTAAGDSSPRKSEHEGSKEKEEKLNVASPAMKIIEALVDPVHGLSLIQTQAGLPVNTFISAEAVEWCRRSIQGAETIAQAVALFQRLMDDQLILHCSGHSKHKFIYGFYLYYIPQKLVKAGQTADISGGHPSTHFNTPGANFNFLFQNEWCEVSVLPVQEAEEEEDSKILWCYVWWSSESDTKSKFYVPHEPQRQRSDSMLLPEQDDWRVLTGQRLGVGNLPDDCDQSYYGGVRINDYYKATLLHKYTNVEVDPQRKSDRNEYAIARYHAYYSPKSAFELQLQWMVATGCIMGDLVYAFARRATSCGFHLIPVPCDPFALPYTENSDPLRGPIFVPLNMQALNAEFLQDLPDSDRQQILYFIQDAIIKRFGFLPASVKVPASCESDTSTTNHQYVHCTAGMFIFIPESITGKTPDLRDPSGDQSKDPKSSGDQSHSLLKKCASELHKLYIARQGRPESVPNEVGFLWSWNYMSSKRWRSVYTGDEAFQDRMLADFRKFCSNDEDRLAQFWAGFEDSVKSFMTYAIVR
ncbi:GATOR complex protein Iml1-like [Physella acuta]|uniref:GATOR complex protein Iml1-like n=1 Tax=Physella acuta TaxID=109671 RepID=UPI0027DEA2A0|nr:GATOR complex protein Iml1-like [Physella acuta]